MTFDLTMLRWQVTVSKLPLFRQYTRVGLSKRSKRTRRTCLHNNNDDSYTDTTKEQASNWYSREHENNTIHYVTLHYMPLKWVKIGIRDYSSGPRQLDICYQNNRSVASRYLLIVEQHSS